MTDAERVEEIRKRESEATKGPWVHTIYRCSNNIKVEGCCHFDVPRVEDGSFISHSREDIPFLLSLLDKRDEELAMAKERIAHLERMAALPSPVVTDEKLNAAINAYDGKVVEYDDLRQVADEMAAALRLVKGSGVSFEDARLDYREVQIDKITSEFVDKAIAAYEEWEKGK